MRLVLKEWHRQALPFIRTKEFDESWSDFVVAWERVKCPAGPSFAAAAAAADADEMPEIVERLEYDGCLRRLTALCWHLHRQWGEQPFPLGCAIAGRFLGVSAKHAARLQESLEFDGVLKRVTKGTMQSGKASEWRYTGGEK
jgi:hypothetical protein